jgi:hypothetical protein
LTLCSWTCSPRTAYSLEKDILELVRMEESVKPSSDKTRHDSQFDLSLRQIECPGGKKNLRNTDVGHSTLKEIKHTFFTFKYFIFMFIVRKWIKI